MNYYKSDILGVSQQHGPSEGLHLRLLLRAGQHQRGALRGGRQENRDAAIQRIQRHSSCLRSDGIRQDSQHGNCLQVSVIRD